MANAVALRLRPLWWGLGFAGVGVVVALSLVPHAPGIPGDHGGWAGHVLAYATMMGWFSRLVPSARKRLAMGAAFCALGVAMEYAQRATGYRSFDGVDMVADVIGVGIGWLASPPRAPHGIAALDRALARWMGPDNGSSA